MENILPYPMGRTVFQPQSFHHERDQRSRLLPQYDGVPRAVIDQKRKGQQPSETTLDRTWRLCRCGGDQERHP